MPARGTKLSIMTASENEFAISICLATYQRPTQLKQLLKALNQQSHKANEIVIVDNDAQGSANSVVQAFLNEYPDAIPIRYSIQAEKTLP